MKKILCLASLLGAATFANAQVRNADISVEITSPTNNQVYAVGDTAWLSFNYTNHGPDVLPAGDTLFFYSGGQVVYSLLTQDMPVNATFQYNNIIYYLNNTGSDISGELCLLHLKQSDIIYADSTNPMTTYVDNNATNDTSCVNVTLQGGTGTGIKDAVVENGFEFYPNPAVDQVFIKPISATEMINISVVNAFGQKVYANKVAGKQEHLEINTKLFPAGVYIIYQETDNVRTSAKMVITK